MSNHLSLKSSEHEAFYNQILKNDQLYIVIKGNSLYGELFTGPFIEKYEENRLYSTSEVAEWLDVTDALVRYYIKHFNDYIFQEGAPATGTNAHRLDIVSAIRLKMIFLLKDEYKVKGLQKLLGLNGEGVIVTQPKLTPGKNEDVDLKNEVQALKNMVESLLTTGLFQSVEDSSGKRLELNENFSNKFQLLLGNSEQAAAIEELTIRAEEIAKENSEIKERIEKTSEKLEKTTEENEKLLEQIKRLEETSSMKDDIAVRIREQQIIEDLKREMRMDAIKEFESMNKSPLFGRRKWEQQKEDYVNKYMKDNLDERLRKELTRYNEAKLN